ncbi:Syntaxin-71 -like protein [Gossypium arboreum]|uniref:Syntaxin-71-like protein n=1 Tax=Gossypium arboreum TaxID=29729 RepID=A0A0B0PQH9_GOSAR|nr:Syntaxin-71 -like protein [Gossypium arboreum]
MTVIDILFRVDEICKKYDKYDPEKQRETNAFLDDAFARLYSLVEADIEKALAKSDKVSTEKNRAAAVALSAEIRRIKARLMEEVPKLQKLAKKKVKGLSKEDHETRFDMVLALPDRIKAIPDGSTAAASESGGWGTSSSNKKIKFDSSEERFGSDFYQQTEESDQFRQDYEMRKMKQACLDVISEGLDTLKNIALDMNEEIDRQVPLMDEIETKVDKTTSDIRKNNVRLKKTITQIRSSRNFCIDIILLCIILGIAFYLYNALK